MQGTTDPRQQWLVHLNRRAAHCRRLAANATSAGIADELSQLAEGYETEAAQLLGHPEQIDA